MACCIWCGTSCLLVRKIHYLQFLNALQKAAEYIEITFTEERDAKSTGILNMQSMFAFSVPTKAFVVLCVNY